jgi:EmrB/QacA subfamily drug resistance transporter
VSSAQRWTLAAVCVSTALLLINVAAPNVALTAIAKDLDASFTDLQWVLSGYSLVLAVFQLTAGSIADLLGRKRLFVTGLCLFMVASALCALAPSAGALIGARALQGLGAAIVFPASLALLAQEFEGPDRRRAIGIWGAVIGLAFAAGPLVGGVLVDLFGWQAIFALGVVLGLPTTALAVLQVRESRDPDPNPVDWPGVATLSAGLFLVVFAVLRGNALGWTSGPVLVLAAGGVACLAAFAVVELRATAPMLDLRLFRNRTFLGATVIVATLSGGSFGAFVYLSLFLLDVAQGSPVEVGLWLAPLAVMAFAVSLAAGRLSARVPLTGALAVGMGLCAVGLALMTGVDASTSWLHLLAGLAIVGAGTGLANPLVTFAHLGVLPPAQGGLASGINNTARQLGLAVGIAVLGALLQSRIADRVEQRTTGLGHARRAVAARIADGDVAAATELAPAAARDSLRTTYEAAFASGLNEILVISGVLALLGLAAALVLVRSRDLWQSNPQPGV